MLGKLSSSLTALGKHRTRNKEDRGRPAANAFQLQLQQLSHFELAGLAQLGSMYQSPRLSSAQRAARAGSCRLGSGWLRLVELLQHYHWRYPRTRRCTGTIPPCSILLKVPSA